MLHIRQHISRTTGGKWLASVEVDGKPRSLGKFSNETAAAVAVSEFTRMIRRNDAQGVRASCTLDYRDPLDRLLADITAVPVVASVEQHEDPERWDGMS